ncbi:MAG: hypothetical protein WA765_16420 [Candidatus Acidiferrum sp.]
MRTSHALLFGLAMLMPAVCRAQMKCPWVNEATARGILGGPVAVTVKIIEPSSGVCEFSRQQGAVLRELTISVNAMTDIPKQFPSYLSQCPPKSAPLRAIGNEAVMCSVQTHRNLYAEKVVGRVREQAFIVSIGSGLKDDPSLTPELRREKANLVAEMVAGNLF